MKRIALFLICLLLTFCVFADPLIKYDKSITESDTVKRQTSGSFTVTFKGASYTDIGFSSSPTTIGSAGLEKSSISNNRIVMTREASKDDKYHCYAEFYIYWYVSLTGKMNLTLTVDSNDNELSLYRNDSETALTLTNNSCVLKNFGEYIAVYHDNSKMKVEAVLTSYPKDKTVATLTLKMEANS